MNYRLLKKIDELLLRSFVSTFFLLLALVLFVLVIQTFFLIFTHIAGKGLACVIYVKLLCYLGLSVLPEAFPPAILIASLIVFGNLSERFELTAMRSAGISLQRILRWPFLFILMVSSTLIYFNDYVHPTLNAKIMALMGDVVEKKAALLIQEGIICNNIPGYSIYVNKKLPSSDRIEGLVVYDYTTTYGSVAITVAESGRLYTISEENYLVMELTNGHNYVEALPDKTHATNCAFYRSNFTNQKIWISLDALKLHHSNDLSNDRPHTKIHGELLKMIQEHKQAFVESKKMTQSLLTREALRYHFAHHASSESRTQDTLNQTSMEDFFSLRDQLLEKQKVNPTEGSLNKWSLRWTIRRALEAVEKFKKALLQQQNHVNEIKQTFNKALYEQKSRPAMAMRCLIIFLLGAPLGCIIRRGGFGPSVIISFFFIIWTYIVNTLGTNWAETDTLPAFIGAWIANFSLLPFCCLFLRKAREGTDLLIESPYFFRYLKNYFKKRTR